MKVSSRTCSAPRILTDLARNQVNGPVQIGEMSKRLGISVKYLEQIIKTLRKAHFIIGVRGAKGGYVLTRKPERITLGQLVKLMEGGFHLPQSYKIRDPFSRMDESRLRRAWSEAIQALYSKLDTLTLADIMGATSIDANQANGHSRRQRGTKKSQSVEIISP